MDWGHNVGKREERGLENFYFTLFLCAHAHTEPEYRKSGNIAVSLLLELLLYVSSYTQHVCSVGFSLSFKFLTSKMSGAVHCTDALNPYIIANKLCFSEV